MLDTGKPIASPRALMAQMICSGETVGVQKGDSGWCWSTKIIALPPSVLQWWIHVAHGCLSITDNGGYLFAGGKFHSGTM